MVQGLAIEGTHYAGGSFDWVNPFALLSGLGLVVGYALLGAAWLVLKTEGELQDWARAGYGGWWLAPSPSSPCASPSS